MQDSIIMFGILLSVLLILKLVSAYLGVILRLINRYTFNIIPRIGHLFQFILGAGLSSIFIIALLCGFGTGFYALYKGTEILIPHLIRHTTSVKVMGEVLDANNQPNMSRALVGFKDHQGQSHEFVYVASYNGTTFTKGSAIPVYYLPENIENSATLNLWGAYGAVGFLYLYGFAVAGFFIARVYLVWKKSDEKKTAAQLDTAPIYLKIPVSKLLSVNDDVIIQLDYKAPSTGKVFHYFSQNIAVSASDLIRLENAFFTVKVNPQNYAHYEFDKAQIQRLLGH